MENEDKIINMVLTLQDCETLSSFEYDFINDLADRESFWLSEKQEEMLKQIYYKHI